MSFFFYRLFYRALRLLISFFSFLLPEKIQAIIADRRELKLVWRTPPQIRPIWFHCASGEIEYIKPLLRKIKAEQPEKSLFLTYFSSSGKPMAERAVFQTLEADGMAPLPWDEPAGLRKFLHELNPSCLVISRTDLWPELLRQCRSNNIPTILVAGTFAPGSKKMSTAGKIFLSLSLPLLNKICLVSEDDKKMIQGLFPHLPFAVTGDPRFDQVIYRIQYQQKELPKNLQNWATGPVWVVGSTWPEDEAVIIPALKQLNNLKISDDNIGSSLGNQSKSFTVKMILVPHETEAKHLDILYALLDQTGINYTLFSKLDKNEEIRSQIQVVIFDQKGYLLDLYRLASLAFIGGSFKQQVHSVMEALGQGCFVLVGPYHLNNREAIAFQKVMVNSMPLVTYVQSSDDMAKCAAAHFCQQLKQLQQHKPLQGLEVPNPMNLIQDQRKLVQEKFRLNTGATELIYQELRDYL
jgi:3-deoxy-D-manno-octulosonic-acid transferase